MDQQKGKYFSKMERQNGRSFDKIYEGLAEGVGFEPTVPLLGAHSLSRRAPSATRSPLLGVI